MPSVSFTCTRSCWRIPMHSLRWHSSCEALSENSRFAHARRLFVGQDCQAARVARRMEEKEGGENSLAHRQGRGACWRIAASCCRRYRWSRAIASADVFRAMIQASNCFHLYFFFWIRRSRSACFACNNNIEIYNFDVNLEGTKPNKLSKTTTNNNHSKITK